MSNAPLPPPDLVLYIDETFPWRIADEVLKRGRPATSHKHLNLSGTKDPDLFPVLAAQPDPVVLVTYDNAMPLVHADDLKEHDITLAVVDKEGVPPNLTVEQYWRDVIHRFAHQMGEQVKATWWKYRATTRRRIFP